MWLLAKRMHQNLVGLGWSRWSSGWSCHHHALTRSRTTRYQQLGVFTPQGVCEDVNRSVHVEERGDDKNDGHRPRQKNKVRAVHFQRHGHERMVTLRMERSGIE